MLSHWKTEDGWWGRRKLWEREQRDERNRPTNEKWKVDGQPQSASRISFMKRKDQLSRTHISFFLPQYTNFIFWRMWEELSLSSPPINYSIVSAALWMNKDSQKSWGISFPRIYARCLTEVMSALAGSQDDKLQPQSRESSARQAHRQMQRLTNYFC